MVCEEEEEEENFSGTGGRDWTGGKGKEGCVLLAGMAVGEGESMVRVDAVAGEGDDGMVTAGLGNAACCIDCCSDARETGEGGAAFFKELGADACRACCCSCAALTRRLKRAVNLLIESRGFDDDGCFKSEERWGTSKAKDGCLDDGFVDEDAVDTGVAGEDKEDDAACLTRDEAARWGAVGIEEGVFAEKAADAVVMGAIAMGAG